MKGRIMIAIVVLMVLAVMVTGLWLWKSRGRVAPPAANNPSMQTTEGETPTKPSAAVPDNRAKVLQGLEGINMGDINSELQDINENSAE